jgi:hypothetical protein
MKRTALSTVVLACLLAPVLAVSTLAEEFAFFTPIVGSNPGVTIAGVPSGGVPWVVRHGVAVLNDEGRLRVEVRGLILPSTGNASPVTQVDASVVCADTVAATTDPVTLTTDGNAQIRAKLSVPSPCFGTIILIRAAGINGTLLPQPGPWIAASGVVKDSDEK